MLRMYFLLYFLGMTNLSDELAWRGFINQTTFSDIEAINEPRTFYWGVDPMC